MTEKHHNPVSSWTKFAEKFHDEMLGLDDEFVKLMMEMYKKGIQISALKIEEEDKSGFTIPNKTAKRVPVVCIPCPTKDPNYTFYFQLKYKGPNSFYLYLMTPQNKAVSRAFVSAKHILKINWSGNIAFPNTNEVIPVIETVRKDMANMHFY